MLRSLRFKLLNWCPRVDLWQNLDESDDCFAVRWADGNCELVIFRIFHIKITQKKITRLRSPPPLCDISTTMSSPSLSPIQRQDTLVKRIVEVFGTSWDLGLVMFGGPPVHFQIVSLVLFFGEGELGLGK